MQADYKPGERVLDIGCGGGGTTIAIAKAVAPSGEVLGIDISPDGLASVGGHLKPNQLGPGDLKATRKQLRSYS